MNNENEFAKGNTDPVGDCGKYEAGIHVGEWAQRIVVYGDTAAEAEALRDRVLATLSPAHIEDGEEVELVGYRHVALNVKSMSSVCHQDHPPVIPMVEWSAPEPLMTVAQHQRIVAGISAERTMLLETFVALCDYLGIDPQQARKLPGKPSEVFIAAIEARAALSAPPAAGVPEDLREAVADAVAEALGEALDCTRVWSAWGVGTMSEDDFRQVADDPERVAEIADAAIAAMVSAAPTPPAAGTTSDQYRAELYDEVWQKARDMGYGNVTDALVELERIKAAPPAAGARGRCPVCEGRRVVYDSYAGDDYRCEHCDGSGSVEFLTPPAAGVPEGWQPMETAPTDGTLLRLLVEFEDHPIEDGAGPFATVGTNYRDNTGKDAWQIVGWCWEQDRFIDGVGTPVGWMPMLAAAPTPPAAGTTSDQYRAELYDEVWQKARDLGYGNVTDALVELERIKAAPPAAGVPDVGALIKRLQGCEPHLTDKVHYCSDDADDYRTYKLDLYIPTPARDPEPFEVAAARWLGAAPTPPAAVPAELTNVRCMCGDEYPHNSYGAGFIAGSGMCENCDAAIPAKEPPAAGVPEGWKLVPIEPTEEMWGGVARSLMLWLDFGNHTVEKLRELFDMLGIGWPEWMDSEAEMKGPGVPSKGTRCTLIYKAMLAAAPTPPASEQQRAVVMPERKPYPDPDGCSSNPEWWARKHEEAKSWNACLAEFLRLNPHLAKGEGV